MAFLIDRGIAAESEEEFDAEIDRYEELKDKLLGGQTMKYEEMEELLAAAKSKNDREVIGILKNVVDDPATDAVTESGSYVRDDGDLKAADDKLQRAIDKLVERKDLTADECEWDGADDKLILTYRGIEWDEGHAVSALGPNKGGWFAEGIKDDVESDLARICNAFLSSSGFDLEFAQDSVQTAIDDASELVRKDGKDAISRKKNMLGEWEYAADCVVRIPCRLIPMRAMSEDDEIEEKEELLPDRVVNEAIEMLRRMY